MLYTYFNLNFSDSSEDKNHTAEYVVGYIMLGICALFLLISIGEIIGKTIYRIRHKKDEADVIPQAAEDGDDGN
ncbi:hypothetical protein KM1_056990 [Entamoeba histolytica HM-3:IMSS]|uniref:Uncharacterized protein n=1 Tax=Entamoeba histolytica HM-3:IMSS TaxID=885315 RepID=M7XCH5_ENTHI|nr:hypothetical protein KM1_056990 [Entamoeba histolytica HM-3:IMSS]